MLPLLFSVALVAAPQTPAAPLEGRLRAVIAAGGAEVAVAYRTLDGRTSVFIDADRPFHAASTMKVPVMIELYRQAHAGTLDVDDPLAVTNRFHSIVDGSNFELADGDPSDAVVFAALGRTLPMRALCEAMITVSSNFAANLLIERLGVRNIRDTMTRLGAGGMQVLRGVEDQKAFDRGLVNTTTARALLVLLERLAGGRAVDPRADAEMVAILVRQQLSPDAIPAGVAEGTVVAHKTGSITGIHHDAAIVFAPAPYVLVVLVRGLEDVHKSAALIAEVSRTVYESPR